MKRSSLLSLCLLVIVGCKTAPEVIDVAPPTVPQEDFTVVSQNLNQVDVKYTGSVEAGTDPIVIESAKWEFVVDGAVKRSGEDKLGLKAAAGEKVDFSFSESLAYVKDEEELKAMDARGGSLLLAMRGTLVLKVTEPARGDAPAGAKTVELPFAKSREVRTPRLPHIKLVEFEAGRFSEVEVQATFHLGVVNPHPFEIRISGIDYAVSLSGKEVNKGTIGAGERANAAATSVFDVTATLNEESHGKDAAKIVKGLVVPYVLSGTLKTTLTSESLESKGDIKLKATK
ncbi:MAG: LEA type 2 family protein [Archangium sp.]|nr:LEA type 2 family protein [Archangium sp.]